MSGPRSIALAAVLLAAAAAGCNDTAALHSLTGASTIAVELAPDTVTGCGEGEQPLPYDSRWVKLHVTFSLLDAEGNPFTDYDGNLHLFMIPGEVDKPYLQMKNGRIDDMVIGVQHGFGKDTHLWVETMAGRGKVAGVSKGLCFANPRIRDTQDADRSYTSPLNKEEVFVDHGTMLVTGFSQTGFYVSDVSACVERQGWTPESGRSRLDCDRERHRVQVKLNGVAPALVRAPERLDESLAVFPVDAPESPYDPAEYVVTPLKPGNDPNVGVARSATSRIPNGATVIVEWVGRALAFNSLYVYTYQAPVGIVAGSRVCSLTGGITEFLGLTELNFPSYRVYLEGGAAAAIPQRTANEEEVPDPRDDESFIYQDCALEQPDWQGPSFIPDPLPIKGAAIPGAELAINDAAANLLHMKLDAYESGLVVLENVQLPTRWKSCDLDGSRQIDRCYDQDREAGRCLPNQMAENDCEMACATAGRTGLTAWQTVADFANCTEQTNFDSYGQYLVTVVDRDANGSITGRGAINLNTRLNVPEFDPRPIGKDEPYGRLYPFTDRERKVKSLKRVVGTLFQVDSARPIWEVIPRSVDDIVFEFVQ